MHDPPDGKVMEGIGRAKPVFTLVCPVRNQRSHNRVFWETLTRYSYHPFHLIVVDNASTDGSGDYFRSVGATVLRQDRNTPYPEAMNLGTAMAQTEFVCHINNDVIVGVRWDRILLEEMERHGIDFACPASLEFLPTLRETRRGMRRWRRIGKQHPHASAEELYTMWRKMYPDWEAHCEENAQRNQGKIRDGISGHTVMVRKSSFDRIGGLDERHVASDWDLYLTARKRELTVGDVKCPKVVLSSFVHHFRKATVRSMKVPWESERPIEYNFWAKWTAEDLERMWPYPSQIHSHPKFFREPMRAVRFHFKRMFDLYEWEDDW